MALLDVSRYCFAPVSLTVSSLEPFYRYWGSDVSSQTSNVSLASLHRLARRRAAARQTLSQERRQVEASSVYDGDVEDERPVQLCSDGGLGCSIPIETDSMDTAQELPPVTHMMKSSLPAGVHARLPAWITRPRLVDVDIVSGSVPLTSVPLPAVISSNLQTMGCTSLFPVQVVIVVCDVDEVILLPI